MKIEVSESYKRFMAVWYLIYLFFFPVLVGWSIIIIEKRTGWKMPDFSYWELFLICFVVRNLKPSSVSSLINGLDYVRIRKDPEEGETK